MVTPMTRKKLLFLGHQDCPSLPWSKKWVSRALPLSTTGIEPGHWHLCYCCCRKTKSLLSLGSRCSRSCTNTALAYIVQWPQCIAARESQSPLAFQALQFRKALERVGKWMLTPPPQIKGSVLEFYCIKDLEV